MHGHMNVTMHGHMNVTMHGHMNVTMHGHVNEENGISVSFHCCSKTIYHTEWTMQPCNSQIHIFNPP
jgi:hypothetical protein